MSTQSAPAAQMAQDHDLQRNGLRGADCRRLRYADIMGTCAASSRFKYSGECARQLRVPDADHMLVGRLISMQSRAHLGGRRGGQLQGFVAPETRATTWGSVVGPTSHLRGWIRSIRSCLPTSTRTACSAPISSARGSMRAVDCAALCSVRVKSAGIGFVMHLSSEEVPIVFGSVYSESTESSTRMSAKCSLAVVVPE